MIDLRHYDTILSPIITEKSTIASEHNKFVFNVSLKSKKSQIKEAIESIFSVRVLSVNTLIRKGKTKRFRRYFGRQSDVKKAIVTLEDGCVIDVASKI